jgi:nicotinate-nucleotide adenylyltransferase
MILVYGGSFNPPTIAHQAILEKLINLYPEAKIIVVPVGDHYRKNDLAPFFHRLEMVKLMIGPYQHVIISSMEGIHPFTGTIDTLEKLSVSYDDLYVVMGQDQLEYIDSWVKAKKLLEDYPFIIIRRKGFIDDSHLYHKLKNTKHHFSYIDFDMDISATMYRVNPLKQSNLISKDVNDYIIKHQLYKE